MVRRRTPAAPLLFLSPLHKASRQISIHLQGRTSSLGVSPTEGHVLTYLARYAPCPVGELSRVFGMSKSTLTGVFDRLVASGLVDRSLNAGDRRSFLVAATPDGKRTAASLRAHLDSLEREISARISGAEMAGFQRVMDAITEVTQVKVRPDERPGRTKKKKP